MKILFELDDDLYVDYCESVGAFSDDANVVAILVVEALERHMVEAVVRVRGNRRVSEAYTQAAVEAEGLRKRVREKTVGDAPNIG